MTASNDTHRESVNSTGAHGSDVQQIVTLLRQRSGSATVDYLRELSGFPDAQLRACLDELKTAGKIDVHTGVESVRIELRERAGGDRPLVTDGSGRIEDLELSMPSSLVFDLLSSERRRLLIKILAEFTPTDAVGETHHELRDLATALATTQTGLRRSEMTSQQRNRVYISLCQTHAEVLDNAGVATYHRRVKQLTPSDDVHALATIIEAIEAAAGRT